MASPTRPAAAPSATTTSSLRPGQDWVRLMLEFVIVVAGISLSLFLQDLREQRSMRTEEERFLAGFERDLRSDLELLRSRTKGLEIMASGLRAARSPETRADLSAEELDRIMDAALTYVAFAPSKATYLELRQAGGSGLIRDKSLLTEIIRLYETGYASAVEWDQINRNLVLERMFPYVEQYGPDIESSTDGTFVSGYHAAFVALEGEQWFRNLLGTNATFKAAQEAVYGNLATKIEGVLTLLEQN